MKAETAAIIRDLIRIENIKAFTTQLELESDPAKRELLAGMIVEQRQLLNRDEHSSDRKQG